MSLFQKLSRLADRLPAPDDPPTPETATRAEIAEYCGIEHPGIVPDWAVPVEAYREQGVVVCERGGQEPDPPWIVVAKYDVPAGGREVLAHTVAAELLAEHYGLDEPEAEVLALNRAGWTSPDMTREWTPLGHHAQDAPELLQAAKRAVEPGAAGVEQ